MKKKKPFEKYIAFLRGINVGGHHKVPMLELRKEMEKLKFENIVTLLNSGNIIFDAVAGDAENLETTLSEHLEKSFGFPIPVILRSAEMIDGFVIDKPFENVCITKDIRLYVSFLRHDVETDLILPWLSDDKSYRIICKKDKTIFSILDLSLSQTPKAMGVLEKYYGKDITTRNWNTIKRIKSKLENSSS